MNRNINYKDFQSLLLQNNTPTACQYLESLWDAYTAYMPLSFNLAEEMAKRISQDEAAFLDKMNSDINQQLKNEKRAVFSPKISDYPNSVCNIGELDFYAATMFRKSVYDFMHWARLCLELPPQLIRALFDLKNTIKDRDTYLTDKIKHLLKEENRYSKLLQMIIEEEMADEYKYIRAFDNSMKHVKLIPITVIAVRMIVGEEPPYQFEINGFSHGKFSAGKVNALAQIDKIEEFARTRTHQMLLEIRNIVTEGNLTSHTC